jgi:osmotically-inducible protein OsmY
MKTDSQVQQDVLAELKWEPSVNAAHIGVEVKDGVVTLAGHVGTYAEKWDAERAAQRVSGVKALAVEMDVRIPGISKRSDADIANSVENVLLWMTYWPKESVKVIVEDGWVTLSGEVSWNYQKQAAADGVRYLMGVTGVSNQLTIKHSKVFDTIKADIEAVFKRRPKSDVTVAVKGGDVTLTGTVHTWPEHDAASNAAWGAAGVHSVKNNIEVIY